MVDMGISSNIMKSPSTACYMTSYIDQSVHEIVTLLLDRITICNVITLFCDVSIGHLQRVELANRWRLLLRTPGPVPCETSISNAEAIYSWTCHVYEPFELQTSLSTTIFLATDLRT